jgi:hypothetical protein
MPLRNCHLLDIHRMSYDNFRLKITSWVLKFLLHSLRPCCQHQLVSKPQHLDNEAVFYHCATAAYWLFSKLLNIIFKMKITGWEH